MACFDSGVAKYIRGYAVVETNFPVEQDIVNYPEKYVGSTCPLEVRTDV